VYRTGRQAQISDDGGCRGQPGGRDAVAADRTGSGGGKGRGRAGGGGEAGGSGTGCTFSHHTAWGNMAGRAEWRPGGAGAGGASGAGGAGSDGAFGSGAEGARSEYKMRRGISGGSGGGGGSPEAAASSGGAHREIGGEKKHT